MVSDLLMRRLIIKHVGYKRDCRQSLLPVAVTNIRHIFLPCNLEEVLLIVIGPSTSDFLNASGFQM